jgi:hypothetical protein
MMKQQTKQLILQTKALVESSRRELARSRAILNEAQHTLMRSRGDYDKQVEMSVHGLLSALPANGEWVSPPEKYKSILSDLFDAGTTLIEEHIYATWDGDLIEWLVRLTPRGMIEREIESSENHSPYVGNSRHMT